MSVQKEYHGTIDYGDLTVTDGISVFDPAFDERFVYDGDDLGAVYSPERTRFRLWAPTASEAKVVLYDTWDGTAVNELPMQRDVKGTWTLTVEEDCRGLFYTYRVKVGQSWNEAVDPYAKAVGVNGEKAAILDLRSTDPQGWEQDVKPSLASPVEAVIYELHLRDLSIHPHSGIRQKSKFLGLTEEGTRGPEGIPTGLDHIAGLGVTHVQLLPVFDYSRESVDESRLDEPHYNWGYDPQNYNVPEGSYATDPYDPAKRITELKQLVQTLHARGLRVIMDVVYNHVYDGYLIHFTKLVPGYYLRYKADGTLSDGAFCGNECASERPMMSKYIVESILHWVREYHIDGFRFDLLGLIDIETMNEIRRRLDEIDPSILMIGEGWMMETVLPKERRANQENAGKLPGIGMFNDGMRDAVKGDIFIFDRKGFISAGEGFEDGVKRGVAGGIDYDGAELKQFAVEPIQSVNFVECHDNHTLWDKIELSTPDASDDERRAMHRLASAIVLTSQGIPFLHAGQEFMRTKGGVENSYKSPIETNWLDWERCAAHQDDVSYLRSLIALRQAHPAFRLRTADEIRAHLRFEAAPPHAVAYTLRDHAGGDPDRHLYVLYNATPGALSLELPALGPWEVRFGGEHVLALQAGASESAAAAAPAAAGGPPAGGARLEVRGVGVVVLAVPR
ncbi:MAG: type I pullulanase [Paenibacillus sp.]|uniref:type I pullulanase n=1 Tax=Paenibacillus sp. TaxID=58172 RepID=UPI002907DA3E|nr:type I pullulanase [Paenibacillus sp.]MDU4697221.1 type I pullulanase [Paenibacillus sp.]